ncbi:LysR family transcriptional regulator [Rhodovibrionaceae bacterium A322]
MKLRQLEFVRAIAESRSFSRAAEICNASQPTLSNSLSQLEEELGGKLFTRTTRQVSLTPFGQYLLPYLESLLDHRDEALAAAKAFHNPVHKLLRIGFSPLVDMHRLDRILQPFRDRHPDVSIFFKECSLDDITARLTGNQVDMAIVPRLSLSGGFEQTGFYQDRLYYLPREGTAGTPAPTGPISLQSLPDVPLILTDGSCGLTGTLTRLFEQNDAQFRSYPGQAKSYQAIEEWVDLGIGAAILPQAKLRLATEQARPLVSRNGLQVAFDFDWTWNRAQQSQPHLADFISYIKNTVPALIDGEKDHQLQHREQAG